MRGIYSAYMNNITYWMFDKGREFTVQMSGEPVIGLELVEQFLTRRTAQRVVLHFFLKKLFTLQQLWHVAIVIDPSRPIVRDEDVYGFR